MKIIGDFGQQPIWVKKAINLTSRVMFALALTLFALISVSIYSLYEVEHKQLDAAFGREMHAIKSYYDNITAQRFEVMRAQMEAVLAEKSMVSALARADRDALWKLTQPLFTKWRESRSITHFYFYDSERKVILRLHQPEYFGDTVERASLFQSEQAGQFSSGLELGPLGTLTLRTTTPVHDVTNRLVGYVEIGEEIDTLVSSIENFYQCQCLITVHKDLLNKNDWNAGMHMLGHDANWDSFPSVVIVHNGLNSLPNNLRQVLVEEQHPHVHWKHIELILEGHPTQVGFIPLLDQEGREVGDLVVTRDITAQKAITLGILNKTLSTSLATALILIILFYYFMRRMENHLNASRQALMQRLGELEAFQRVAVNRELRVQDLKNKIWALENGEMSRTEASLSKSDTGNRPDL